MHNTPQSSPKESPRSGGRIFHSVLLGMAATGMAAYASLQTKNNSENGPTAAVANDLPATNKQTQTLAVQPVSIEKPKGPRTLEQLDEGEIPHGTEIKLIDQNGDSFVLATAENGDILVINGERFSQSATASKKTFVGAVPLGVHPIAWHKLEKKTEGETPYIIVYGGQKGEKIDEKDPGSKRTQQELATLCRNAKANGKFQFALPNKTVGGVDVTLVGEIKKIEK